jgi:hypothetical protein
MLSATSKNATRNAVAIVAGSDAVRRTLRCVSGIAASGAATVKVTGGICRIDLQELCNSLLDDVGRLHTPLSVLVSLQNVSHCTLEVEVLGAWILARTKLLALR